MKLEKSLIYLTEGILDYSKLNNETIKDISVQETFFFIAMKIESSKYIMNIDMIQINELRQPICYNRR